MQPFIHRLSLDKQTPGFGHLTSHTMQYILYKKKMVKTTVLKDNKPRLKHIMNTILQKFVITIIPRLLLFFEDIMNEQPGASFMSRHITM